MKKTRQQALSDLVLYATPIEQLVRDLGQFPWDSENAWVILDRRHVAAVLTRYISGELSAAELEAWANAIESREDIDYDAISENVLQEAIHQLANPLLTVPITSENVEKLLRKLQ